MNVRRSRSVIIALAAVAVAGGLSACGGSGGDAAGAEVASLGTEPVDTTPDDSAAAEIPTDPEEAQLAFAECMREHGIDMPDPAPGGGPMVMQFGADDDADADAFEAAQEECAKYMEAMRGSIEIDPAQQEEMREQSLEFAACMRGQGIDMPDPVFDADRGVQIQRQAGGGQRSDRSDDDFQAAMEECGGPVRLGVTPDSGDDGAALEDG